MPTDRAVPMTATADIGHEIAKLLVGGWTGHRVVELGSRHSPNDLARAVGKALGKTVTARSTPRDHWATSLGHMGVPEASIGLYEEMMESINSGWIDHGVDGAESVASPTTPAQVFNALRS